MKDDRLYLEHIREAAAKVLTYTAVGREDFMNNPMAQDAVIRNFEIIGEATKRLSEAKRQKRPEVPWSDIARFRDVLIHQIHGR